MNLFNEHEIVVEHMTQEMKDWLEKTYPGKYYIAYNMIRYRFAGPSVPLSQCMRQEGYKITFDDEKELLLFKVVWG